MPRIKLEACSEGLIPLRLLWLEYQSKLMTSASIQSFVSLILRHRRKGGRHWTGADEEQDIEEEIF